MAESRSAVQPRDRADPVSDDPGPAREWESQLGDATQTMTRGSITAVAPTILGSPSRPAFRVPQKEAVATNARSFPAAEEATKLAAATERAVAAERRATIAMRRATAADRARDEAERRTAEAVKERNRAQADARRAGEDRTQAIGLAEAAESAAQAAEEASKRAQCRQSRRSSGDHNAPT